MSDDVEDNGGSTGVVRNSITGSPKTAVQTRDFYGRIYVNSQVTAHPQPARELDSVVEDLASAFPWIFSRDP